MANKPYKGVLAKPMTPRDDIKEAHGLRVAALFEHYEVTPGNWCALALALADDHVPGFQIGPPPEYEWPSVPQRPGPAKAARDLLIVWQMHDHVKAGVSVNEAARLVVGANRGLGIESAGAARQLYITIMKGPDRHRARANIDRLIRGTRISLPRKKL